MPISVRCSNCGKALRAPETAIGKQFKCPKCGVSVQVPGGAAGGQVPEASALPPADLQRVMVHCPTCDTRLAVPENLIGKTVKCSACRSPFTAEQPRAAPLPDSPPADFDLFDDSSNEARRYESTSGGLLLACGIVSIVLGISGAVTSFFGFSVGAIGTICCCGCPLGGSPGWVVWIIAIVVCVVGLTFGAISWTLGSRDLRRIARGIADPAGRGTTSAGKVCGTIGCVLNGLPLLLSCVGSLLVAIGLITQPAIPTNKNFPAKTKRGISAIDRDGQGKQFPMAVPAVCHVGLDEKVGVRKLD